MNTHPFSVHPPERHACTTPPDRRLELDLDAQRQLKVLFFGKSMSRSRATRGLVEALTNHGLAVRWVNMATLRRWSGPDKALARARRTFRRLRPDIVFVFCRDLPFELLQEFRLSAVCVLWIEEPLHHIGPEYVRYLAHAHAVFMTNPSKFELLSRSGVDHTAFVMEGFSSTYHFPLRRARPQQQDVIFIGSPGVGDLRPEFLAEVARHYDLTIYGNGWDEWQHRFPHLDVRGPVRPRRYRQLCSSARIVLGINQVNDAPLYFSNRTLLTLACRGFHLTHYVPQLETVFRDGVHLAWFRDTEQCLTLIDSYLGRPEERARIAAAGCSFVHAGHRFHDRIAYVLQVLREGFGVERSDGKVPAVS